MAGIQLVIEDSTDTLLGYPPTPGVPSSVTVRVASPSTAMPTSGDAVTPDAVSATTSAAAAIGSKSLTFSGDPSCTVGRRYLIDDSANGTEPFISPPVIATGSTVYFEEPLPAAVSSGATVSGIALPHALTSAETSEVGYGRAEWTATIGGVEVKWTQEFRVVDQVSAHGATWAECTKFYPIAHALQPRTDATGQEAVDAAWEGRVRIDLEASGIRAERIVSWETLRPVIYAATVYRLILQDRNVDPDERSAWSTEYESLLAAVRGSSELYVSPLAGEAVQPELQPGLSGLGISR